MTITSQEPATDYAPLTDAERKEFHENGYKHLPGVVSPEIVAELQAEADRLYGENKNTGHIDKTGSLHLLGAVSHSSAFARMLDYSPTFRWVWGLAGWNIYSQHNHLDVNPPYEEDETPRWEWHQDGWRQNSDAEYYAPYYGDVPRPMLSIKVAIVLSDISEPGRGQTLCIPGSHLNNHMYRPTDPAEIAKGPEGAVPWLAKPGDAFIFDRRLWHSRSRNRSDVTRKMLFMSYTYRWIRPVDDMPIDRESAWYAGLTPVQRQLIGEAFGNLKVQNMWGVGEGGWIDDTIPLRAELKERGLLDRNVPWLR
ncbi:phytanoyl-CoA dioxygenase family protein [Catellatospora citrea]|uniref:phytanoyl-CoA dioxygenase family protein n=1 Tax=Catellatospora citrea TaxID=53366 RepID=UPI0034021D8E